MYNPRILVMKKKLLLVLVILCFYACEPNVITLPFHVISNSFELKIEPLELKLGEEVIISASHVEGENKPLVVYSKSLGFEDTLITPFVVKKKMTEVGKHDIMFVAGVDTLEVNVEGDVDVDVDVSGHIGTSITVTE